MKMRLLGIEVELALDASQARCTTAGIVLAHDFFRA
jgi:hypothetical protein